MQDMKKIVLWIVLAAFLIVHVEAFASDLDFAPVYVASYWAWAQMFGSTSVSTEYEIGDLNEATNTRIMNTDEIFVKYDNATMKAERIYWHYTGDLNDSFERKARLLGLFAAVEYGGLYQQHDDEISIAYMAAMPAYNEYYDALSSKESEILSGQMILFRISERGTYYVTFDESAGIIVIIE